MRRYRLYGFLLVLTAMVLFLFGMSGYHYYVKTTGKAVRLKTEPVDPRSLFRGDYVRLNYTVNRVERSEVNGDIKVTPGETLYVLLTKTGNHWTAKSLHASPPDPGGKTAAVLRGYYRGADGESVLLEYPSIESYFVPEGTGKKLERLRGKGLLVEVALGSDGYPVIKELIPPESAK